MRKTLQLIISPREASDEHFIHALVAKKLQLENKDINEIRIIKKSIDARTSRVKVNLSLEIIHNENNYKADELNFDFPDVSNKPEVLIIGAGPAGLFAALRLIEMGIKPIIIERGKDVKQRKRDVAKISREQIIDPDSNYCFGEGGAGAFSDGKLYTRSKKRGDYQRILELLHFHGANENILYEAHPHIGTDKLPRIISKIRETIIEAGGEVHFNSKVTDFIVESDEIKGIEVKNFERISSSNVILATGHSARDIYELLHQKQIKIEPKGFAMGVRVEHPQDLVDSIQYHLKGKPNIYLPSASYNLVEQVEGRGVYSFCMCPGGFIVPASTAQNEIVVNGMSPSARNSPFANSGIVVEIKPEDYQDLQNEYGLLAGLKFQQKIEEMAGLNGGRGQVAPAQRLHDFVNGKLSQVLPENSYLPGVASSPLHFWLPESIRGRLQKAFENYGKRMRGYLTNEAIILGVESRTSSPIKIPRDNTTYEHVQIKGLYPCGEGAGYAGGIVSSAIDGVNIAEKIALKYDLK